MIDRFCYNVYIPSLYRETRFYELTNRDYLHILKFIQNNDDNSLVEFLERILVDLAVDKTVVSNFTRVDKYCALLSIIMISVGNVSKYTLNCSETEKEFTIEVVISEILAMINELDYSNIKIPIGDNSHLVMSIPTALSSPSDNIIKELYINEKSFDLTEMTNEQVDHIIDNLPYGTYSVLHDTIAKIHSECYDIIYLQYTSPHTDSEGAKFRFNFYNNTFLDFIKVVLRDNLLSYYKIYHALSSRFGYDIAYIESITPAEVRTYLSLIREDNEDKQKAYDRQKSQSSPSDPVLPSDLGNDPGVESM